MKKSPSTKSARKTRGRTAITKKGKLSSRPNVPTTARAEATRPVAAGAGKHRGDRRDTSRLYTGNAKHAARGNSPRADVSTRKR